MVKILIGLVAATVMSVSAGFASAAPQAPPQGDLTGYTKEQCKNGGWEALGFKNQGQCVSYFAKHKPHP